MYKILGILLMVVTTLTVTVFLVTGCKLNLPQEQICEKEGTYDLNHTSIDFHKCKLDGKRCILMIKDTAASLTCESFGNVQ